MPLKGRFRGKIARQETGTAQFRHSSVKFVPLFDRERNARPDLFLSGRTAPRVSRAGRRGASQLSSHPYDPRKGIAVFLPSTRSDVYSLNSPTIS